MEITNADLLRYYFAWEEYEKYDLGKIENGDVEAFYKYLVGMRIARNFKAGKYKKIYETAKVFLEKNPNSTDADKLSQDFFKNKLLRDGINNAVVAASKILWAFNHKAIIIDNLAKRHLAKLAGKKICKMDDYNFFCKIWEEQYKVFEQEYKDKLEITCIGKIDTIFRKDWFIRRTFDNYLWAGKFLKDKN